MYIPYEEIFNNIGNLFPDFISKPIKSFGYNLKISQNVSYIRKNQPKVIKKLKEKIKNQKLNVAFYIYDEAKWKAQSLFDLMEKSDKFNPYIVVSKNYSNPDNLNYQTQKDVDRIYEFFKNKNMKVIKGVINNQFISFDEIELVPDIVVYSHPWYVYKTQGPVMVSKYALTSYIPYFLPNTSSPIESYLRFHQYVQNFYVLSDSIKDLYSKNMLNKGKNLKAFGHTALDYFYLNKDKNFEDKNTIIYAPHWTIDDKNTLCYGTFFDFGGKILELAKLHPEFNWVFKPHPLLEQNLKKYRSDDEIKSYWDEWKKIGKVVESGDYLDMFMKSKAIISDCGSFQIEYFMTKKPFIYLKSKNPTPFIPFTQKINDTYYKVETLDDLYKTFEEVILNGNDYKKEDRLKLYNELNLAENYAAENIIGDFLSLLN